MPLPNIATADIDLRKLTDYVLNASHPEGRHKARVFLSTLEVTASDAKWIAGAILAALPVSDAVVPRVTTWGSIYRVDMDIVRGKRYAKVQTGWLCTDTGTRLATCFVIGDCDETT